MGVKILVCDIDQFTYLDALGFYVDRLGYNVNSPIFGWRSRLRILTYFIQKKFPKEVYNLIHLKLIAGVECDIILFNKSKNLRNMKYIYISGNYLDRLKYKEYITKRLPSVKVY